jgi:hypothetical protein
MALQFIQYLDRRSFGSRFARLDRETASILLLNATLHDQGRYPTASDRFASTSTSSAWTTSAPEIQSAVGSHVSDTQRGIIPPPDNRISINCCRQERRDYGSVHL